MKLREIHVGGVYRRGNLVRRVVEEGAHLDEGRFRNKDVIRYEVLMGDWRSRSRVTVCTRRSFALWAREQVLGDDIERAERGVYAPPREVER